MSCTYLNKNKSLVNLLLNLELKGPELEVWRWPCKRDPHSVKREGWQVWYRTKESMYQQWLWVLWSDQYKLPKHKIVCSAVTKSSRHLNLYYFDFDQAVVVPLLCGLQTPHFFTRPQSVSTLTLLHDTGTSAIIALVRKVLPYVRIIWKCSWCYLSLLRGCCRYELVSWEM